MAKNLKQLLAQIERLQAQANALKNKERAGVISRIQEAIAHYGLTSEELFSKPARTSRAAPTRQAKATKAAAKAVVKRQYKPGKPKYHDGTGRTWTGQGKRPNWFVAALADGKTAESMLVEQAQG
ncbi:H-NS histone family protein [Nostoc sp. NIES-2111]